MSTFRKVPIRCAVVLAMSAVLAGCLGNDADSNDPEANDPTIMNPEATPGDQ